MYKDKLKCISCLKIKVGKAKECDLEYNFAHIDQFKSYYR